jgi:hypothetical protein
LRRKLKSKSRFCTGFICLLYLHTYCRYTRYIVHIHKDFLLSQIEITIPHQLASLSLTSNENDTSFRSSNFVEFSCLSSFRPPLMETLRTATRLNDFASSTDSTTSLDQLWRDISSNDSIEHSKVGIPRDKIYMGRPG